MQEKLIFRIYKKYAYLLINPEEGKDFGLYTEITFLSDDERIERVRDLSKKIKQDYNESFFLYSDIIREYSKAELNRASLLLILIKKTFEPAGEECGTEYDESVACKICGSNRMQQSPLKLKYGSIPKKDIAVTIAGEVVVSQKFAEAIKKRNLKGISLKKVVCNGKTSDYYQLTSFRELKLTDKTIAGIDLFNLSTKSEDEIYKCPEGHTIGLNLLSEAYVYNSPSINDYDLFVSKQKIGVKRGLLRPEPLYLCSPAFRKMVVEEKLSGFNFEIAHVE